MINENIKNQIKDTLTHKKLVMDSGYKMCEYLFLENKDELALELINRIIVHDNSKFSNKELYGLSSIKDRASLVDPNVLLTQEQEEIIREHWKVNRHHPEFYSKVENMTEIDIIEMCCDWHARSVQSQTNLIDFVETRQKNRFHFPQQTYNLIIKYCKILLS